MRYFILTTCLLLVFITAAADANGLRSRSYQIRVSALTPAGVLVADGIRMWGGVGYPGAGRSRGTDLVLWSGVGIAPRVATGTGEPPGPDEVRELVVTPNVPNPFYGGTAIRYQIPLASAVTTEIYDPAGRLVRKFTFPVLEPGCHTVHWDGRDAEGQRVSPGLYFYRLRTASGTHEGRMMALR